MELALNGLMAPLRYGSVSANRLLQNVAQAFEDILDEQQKHIADIDPSLSDSVPDISSLLNSTRDILPKMSSFLFASQIGMALGQIAQSALGSTDVGIPLADGSTTALVARNIEDFADELEIPLRRSASVHSLCASAHIIVSSPVFPGWLVILRVQSSDTRSILRSIARPSPRPRSS